MIFLLCVIHAHRRTELHLSGANLEALLLVQMATVQRFLQADNNMYSK